MKKADVRFGWFENYLPLVPEPGSLSRRPSNSTGYAQVFAELSGTNGLLRGYEWGLQLEAVRDFTVNSFGVFHYYGYDGHGSVRWLTDANGAITDTYDFDAFGNLVSFTGTTFNNYLFAGEQFDPALGIYYNRARYYDQRQGRFWTADIWDGVDDEPLTLHKYLGLLADPVDNVDHCGKCVPSTGNYGDLVQKLIFADFARQTGSNLTDISINGILNQSIPNWLGGNLRPDLVDTTTFNIIGQIYEIKAIYSQGDAVVKLGLYLTALNLFDKTRKWIPGFTYLPPPIMVVDPTTVAFVTRPAPGVISYCLVNQLELLGLAATAAITGLFLDTGTAVLLGRYGLAY